MAKYSTGNPLTYNPMPGPSGASGYLGTFQGSASLSGDSTGGDMGISFAMSEVALGRSCIYITTIVTAEDDGTREDLFLGVQAGYRSPAMSLPMEMLAVTGRNCAQYHGRLPMIEIRGADVNVLNFTRSNENGKNLYVDVFGLLINRSKWALDGMLGFGTPVGGY